MFWIVTLAATLNFEYLKILQKKTCATFQWSQRKLSRVPKTPPNHLNSLYLVCQTLDLMFIGVCFVFEGQYPFEFKKKIFWICIVKHGFVKKPKSIESGHKTRIWMISFPISHCAIFCSALIKQRGKVMKFGKICRWSTDRLNSSSYLIINYKDFERLQTYTLLTNLKFYGLNLRRPEGPKGRRRPGHRKSITADLASKNKQDQSL